MTNIGKAGIAIIAALISNLPVYATDDCCDGKVKKDPCGCVDPSYKCCTGGDKASADRALMAAQRICYDAYSEKLVRITALANDTRNRLEETYDEARKTISDELTSCYTNVCDAANPGNDDISLAKRLNCKNGCNITARIAELVAATTYFAMTAAACESEASQLLGAIVEKTVCDAEAQSTRDAACDNWP
jgi:hypothetical protein